MVSNVVHRWAGFLLALLGTLHTALAMPELAKGPKPGIVTRRLIHAANLGFLAFGFVAVAAVPEPQAYAILVLIAVQTAAAFAIRPARA